MAKRNRRLGQSEKVRAEAESGGQTILLHEEEDLLSDKMQGFLSDPDRYGVASLYPGWGRKNDKLFRYFDHNLPASFQEALSVWAVSSGLMSNDEDIEEHWDEVDLLKRIEALLGRKRAEAVLKRLVLRFDEDKGVVVAAFRPMTKGKENEDEDSEDLPDILRGMSGRKRDRFLEMLESEILPLIIDRWTSQYKYRYRAAFDDDVPFLFATLYLLRDEKIRQRAAAFFINPVDFSDTLYVLSGEEYISRFWRVHCTNSAYLLSSSVFPERDPQREKDLEEKFSLSPPISFRAQSLIVEDLCLSSGVPTPEGIEERAKAARRKIRALSDFFLGWVEDTEKELVKKGMRGFLDASVLCHPKTPPSTLSADLRREGAPLLFEDYSNEYATMSVSSMVEMLGRTCFPYLMSPAETAEFLEGVVKKAKEMSVGGGAWENVRKYMYPYASSQSPVLLLPQHPKGDPDSLLFEGTVSGNSVLTAHYREQIVNRAWELMLKQRFPRLEAPDGNDSLPNSFPLYFHYKGLRDLIEAKDDDTANIKWEGLNEHERSGVLQCGAPLDFHRRYEREAFCGESFGSRFLAAAFSYALGWHDCWSPKLAKRGKSPSIEVPNLEYWLRAMPIEDGETARPTATLRYQGCKAEDLLAYVDLYGTAFFSPRVSWRWSSLLWTPKACGGVTPKEVEDLAKNMKNEFFVPPLPLDAFVAKALGMSSKAQLEDWDLTCLLSFFAGFSSSEDRQEELRKWVEHNGPPNLENIVTANLQLPHEARRELREELRRWEEKRSRGQRVPSKEGVIRKFLEKKEFTKRLGEKMALDGRQWERRANQAKGIIVNRYPFSPSARSFRTAVKNTLAEAVLESHLFDSPSNWCPHLMGDCSTVGFRNSSEMDLARKLRTSKGEVTKMSALVIRLAGPGNLSYEDQLVIPRLDLPGNVAGHVYSSKWWQERHGLLRVGTRLYRRAVEESRKLKDIQALEDL